MSHTSEKPLIANDIEFAPANPSQSLSQEHHDYLIRRHGTVELDPLPSSDPLDPLNWPDWKKNCEIALIAFTTLTCNIMAGGITPAFQPMAEAYEVSITAASYLTSAQIAVLGVVPLGWVPVMNTYGRNSFIIVTCLICCGLNIAGGFCKTYGQQMATRILVAVFAGTGYASGSSIVADLCFSHERGRKNGWWSTALVIGTPFGPFLTGFIQQHAGTKWIYFFFAILNFVGFLLWCLVDETVYQRGVKQEKESGIIRMLGLKKYSNNKLNRDLFLRPFKLSLNLNVVLAVVALSVTFCYANTVLIVELPQAMGILFNLDAQQLSYQYVSLIVGSFIGEMLAGPLSDWWMKFCIKRRRGTRVIVDRLWLSYNGFICVIVGIIIWGVYLYKAVPGHWQINSLIGAAIASAGNNIVATVLTTFCIDSAPGYAADVGLFLNIWRQIFGFAGPFYFQDMFTNLNFAGSSGLMSGLVLIFGVGITAYLHYMGSRKSVISKL
ncbi:major facilitator superfamily multidrug-resistance protein [Scheffersomyces amazonensis]|uniref:major facilitator superfamily multidrug-resistance protein n=1 Tax=Scheffersomyces amazonensis TaxID=1078765 RepID=UPI00315D2472